MKFTVIATTFNDREAVEKYIENFEKQSLKPDQLVIVDGGSKDGTPDYIRSLESKYSFEIDVFDELGRLNIAQGYNEAIKRSSNDLILITGIGNKYNEKFCESCLSFYMNNNYDIVYTPIVGIEKGRFSRAFNIAFVGGPKGKDFGLASNRGVLLSKKVFEQIGYFYEDFVYAGEDTEYFIRANNAGLKVGYNTEGIVYWETPVNFKEYLKKNKVNAIADMQCQQNKDIAKHISIRCALIIALIVLAVVRWYLPVIAVVGLIGLIVLKIKSVNPLAILLRLHFIFLPSYYYIKNRKYFSQQYKVKI